MMQECHYCGYDVRTPSGTHPLCACPKCGREFWEPRYESKADAFAAHAAGAVRHDNADKRVARATRWCRVEGCANVCNAGAVRGACCACYNFARKYPTTPRARRIVGRLLPSTRTMTGWERAALEWKAKP